MRAHLIDRRGIGTLVAVVALVLAVLFAGGVARSALASRSLGTAQAITAGTLCELAALSAVDEAIAALSGARVEGTPLARALAGGAAEFVQAAPETAQRLASEPLSRDVRIGAGVSVRVMGGAHVGGTGDVRARVWLCAEARHAPTRTVRRLAREHTVRVSRLAVPRPFDALTFAQLDAAALHPRDVNARLARAVEGMRTVRGDIAPKLCAEVTRRIEGVNAELARVAPKVGAAYEPYDVARYAGPFRAERHPEAPVFADDVTAPYHFIPARYAVFSMAARIEDLAAADAKPAAARAETALDAARRGADAARERYEETAREVVEAGRTSPTSERGVRRLMAAMDAWLAATEQLGAKLGDLSRAHEARIELHRAWTDRWRELAGGAVAQLEAQAAALAPDAFRARAQHRFEGAGAAARARAWLERHAAAGAPRLMATVHVDDPAAALDLTGLRIRGRAVVSASGVVVVRDAGGAGEQDEMVIAAREVRAGGDVAATLIAREAFRPEVGLAVRGAVVALAAPAAPLAGIVAARHLTERSQVAFGPWSVSTVLERK